MVETPDEAAKRIVEQLANDLPSYNQAALREAIERAIYAWADACAPAPQDFE